MNTQEVREALRCASCFFMHALPNFLACITQQCTWVHLAINPGGRAGISKQNINWVITTSLPEWQQVHLASGIHGNFSHYPTECGLNYGLYMWFFTDSIGNVSHSLPQTGLLSMDGFGRSIKRRKSKERKESKSGTGSNNKKDGKRKITKDDIGRPENFQWVFLLC